MYDILVKFKEVLEQGKSARTVKFDTGLAIVKKIDHEFDEDEVDTSSFKEMFEAMSKL